MHEEFYVINPKITGRNQNIYIFGTGERARFKYKNLKSKGIIISGFIDRVINKTRLEGVCVYQEDEFAEKDALVIVSSRFWREIVSRLEAKGYTNLIIDNDNSQYQNVEIRDYYLYNVNGINFSKDMVYICCPEHLGDTFFVAALIKEYKLQNNNCKVCLVTKKQYSYVADFFPAIDEVIANDELVCSLNVWSVEMQQWRLKNYLHGFIPIDRVEYKVYEEYRNIEDTHINYWWRMVLGISLDSQYDRVYIQEHPNGGEFDDKSILLAPYSQSEQPIEMEFWEKLVKKLNELGYRCFTNAVGMGEKEIKGTKRYSKNIYESICDLQSVKAVIGVRSGFFDILALTNIRTIVLYTTQKVYKDFDLYRVMERPGIINVTKFDKDDNEVFEQILKGLK